MNHTCTQERTRAPRELQPDSNVDIMDDKEVWEALVHLSALLTESRALAEDGRLRLASLTTTSQAAVAEAEASVQEQQHPLNESVQPDSTADCAQIALQLRDAKTRALWLSSSP
jgi:hypothetical protein